MVADQIMQVVNDIAQKLGVAAEKVYPMLLKQAEVFCSTYSVTLWVTGIAFALLIALIVPAIIAENNGIEILFFISCFGIVVCIITFIITGIIALCDLSDYLTALHNPDLWAIEYVARLVT